ncbi:ABC transporter ATP-binding protein [Verticiella sediminum]|uniref:ABC transporter ATP-binding protein n=1 Tax=Verticiella sediminum TaxID=1247510 RepID=A0A556A906_9BURK|nr:ABC transporter ATP-binding protein [Verticiella sediminum]TSH89373.1 ABC transporter ATP-binding protein [Verticiella sediminum]
MTAGPALLRVEDLAKSFGGVKAVDGVSFAVDGGRMLALIGPNGAGKSTCFNLINGQLRPERGRVSLAGQEVTGQTPRAIWRAGVGRTFQIPATFGSMTVRENLQVALASHARQLGRFWPRLRSLFRDESQALLEQVGMAAQAERACRVLAYGDVKRVELAIALASQPRVLLMDEPTAGMAADERHALMALTRRLVDERGIAVLFTEHSLDVVFAHADTIAVMARGRLIAHGAPADIRNDAQVRAAYLGTDDIPAGSAAGGPLAAPGGNR